MGASWLPPGDVVPLIGQQRGYSIRSLRGDVAAALNVAATLVPQGLAYGAVAGLAPAAGLYTALGAALLFSVVTSTRFVSVGPSATLAIMTFAAVQGPAGGDPARAVALAGCLSALAGVLYVIMALLRMQAVADFLSKPVLLGYLAGSGVVILAGQVGVLVGVPAEGAGLLGKAWYVLTHLDQVHLLTMVVGLSSVAALMLFKRYLPRVPASFVVLLAMAAVSAATDLAGHGVSVVGAVSGGLPVLQIPDVTASDVWALLPPAAGIALVASIESVAAIRATVTPAEPRISLGREATALGAASVAAGALGGFAPMANVSRSLAARGAGAHSQLFQVVGAGIVLFVLFTGGPLVARLPLAALAAVIIVVSVPRLIDVPGFLLLWRSWRTESLIALAAAAGVVVFGVLPGVLVAVLLASGQLVRRAARPPDAVLAVTGPDEPPREVAEHETAGLDVLIYRVDAPLFFANAARVRARILTLASAGEPSLRHVILDAEAVFYLDATAAETVAQLTVDLRERGCRLLLARVRTPVLATLRANPYYDGATRELPAFPSVRQAHAAAQEGIT